MASCATRRDATLAPRNARNAMLSRATASTMQRTPATRMRTTRCACATRNATHVARTRGATASAMRARSQHSRRQAQRDARGTRDACRDMTVEARTALATACATRRARHSQADLQSACAQSSRMLTRLAPATQGRPAHHTGMVRGGACGGADGGRHSQARRGRTPPEGRIQLRGSPLRQGRAAPFWGACEGFRMGSRGGVFFRL